MKKVGIITLHNFFNFGSMLQAYAGQENIRSLGYDCHIIDFRHPRIDNNRAYSVLREPEKYAEWMDKYKNEISERLNKFEDFMSLYNLSRTYRSEEELGGNRDYDICATGGDQVWNCNFRLASSAYFLKFTDCQHKAALSTSIGRCKWEKLAEYEPYIRKYRNIYIREQVGAEMLIQNMPDMSSRISTMLDPTLMLSNAEWVKIEKESSYGECTQDPYIACYATLDQEMSDMLPMLTQLHELTGMRVACFGMMVPQKAEWIDNVVDIGPREWISLMLHASYIMTHSFHGTVFALKFHKPFITYNDDLENPRKESILRMVGLTNRIEHKAENISRIFESEIDFSKVDKIIETELVDSREKLKGALND